jgi:hypothetical protein
MSFHFGERPKIQSLAIGPYKVLLEIDHRLDLHIIIEVASL